MPQHWLCGRGDITPTAAAEKSKAGTTGPFPFPSQPAQSSPTWGAARGPHREGPVAWPNAPFVSHAARNYTAVCYLVGHAETCHRIKSGEDMANHLRARVGLWVTGKVWRPAKTAVDSREGSVAVSAVGQSPNRGGPRPILCYLENPSQVDQVVQRAAPIARRRQSADRPAVIFGLFCHRSSPILSCADAVHEAFPVAESLRREAAATAQFSFNSAVRARGFRPIFINSGGSPVQALTDCARVHSCDVIVISSALGDGSRLTVWRRRQLFKRLVSNTPAVVILGSGQ